MIKNIVFDLGNVLISFDPLAYIKNNIKDKNKAKYLHDEIFKSKEWVQYDRGTISLQGIISAVTTRVPESYHSKVKWLVENWYKDLPVFEEMEELVAELKSKGYKIYLLSNTSKEFHIFKENIPVLEYFDGTFASADYKLIKPEKEIYEKFYKVFDLKAEECFFIDDSPVNIEAAERTGMKGIVYNGKIDNLRKEIKKIW